MIIHMRKGGSCRWREASFLLELLLVSAAWFLVTSNFNFFFWRFPFDDFFCVKFPVDDAGGGGLEFSYSLFFFLLNILAREEGRRGIDIFVLSPEGVELRPVADMVFRGICCFPFVVLRVNLYGNRFA
jgi:hypothetical protein